MREYYIFKIKDRIKLTNTPYNIYKLLNNVYKNKVDKNTLSNVLNYYDTSYFNTKIYNLYKMDSFYMMRNNIHRYNDYFNDEESSIEVYDYYLKLVSNKNLPTFIYDLSKYNDLFIVDFNNYDYFWANEINAKLLV